MCICQLTELQVCFCREEKEDLSQSITRIRNECSDMKHQMAQLESRHTASERIVTALRDALKEERLARNRAEAQRAALGKVIRKVKTCQVRVEIAHEGVPYHCTRNNTF